MHPQGTSLGFTQGINLIIIQKWILMEYFLFFLIPIVNQTLYCRKKLETHYDLAISRLVTQVAGKTAF